MAIKVISPVNLDEGHLVQEGAEVLGGQVVKLVKVGEENHIAPAVAGDTTFPYGFCYGSSKAQPANELYIPFNYKAPLNRQSVILTKGARVELWDDGTEIKVGEETVKGVFETSGSGSVINAPVGTLLYVSAKGQLTTQATTEPTKTGSLPVAVVEVAPENADGVLVARIEL